MLHQPFSEVPAGTRPGDDAVHIHWGAGAHAAQFYRDEARLADSIARYLGRGLEHGDAVLVLATAERWREVGARLRAAGHDLDRLALAGRLAVADAREALGAIMRDGEPDAERFRALVAAAAAPGLAGADRLCVYGELVDLLCGERNHAAAVRLEELWNEVAQAHPMTLLCAYRLDHFADSADATAFRDICDRHAAVVPCESLDDLAADMRAREITRLQQRARALETEIDRRNSLEAELRSSLATQDRVTAELRLARDDAERASRAKSDFLAVMSHELRTPLNAIIGYRDLLSMGVGGEVSAEQQKFLDRINHSAHQLLTLIDQVLSVTRLEAGSEELALEEVDLVQVARDACALLEPIARGKGLTLALETPNAAHCITDGGKLRQILLNLVSNAVKYTRSGSVSVVVTDSGDAVVLEVRDTGVGIPEADLQRIFDRFVQLEDSLTRRYDGTGLGLSLCRDFARIIGAELRVHSELGAGSAFALRVPRHRPRTAPEQRSPA